MVIPRNGREQLNDLIQAGQIDLITFASSSTVENFMKMVGSEAREKVRRIPVASIGPITSETVRRFGLDLRIQPKEYTIPTLVKEIADLFQNPNRTVTIR